MNYLWFILCIKITIIYVVYIELDIVKFNRYQFVLQYTVKYSQI